MNVGSGSTRKLLLTTHKVVIDADDEAQADWLLRALTNDGYRVHRETHRLVSKDGQNTMERERA